MFNLARGRRDHTFLDPFCGVGGVLIEAGLMGCHVIGIDVKEGMIRNCKKNLRHFQLEGDLIISDAEKLPFKSTRAIDCIATDPPYGTSASTLKRETARMVSSFLSESLDILKRKSYICIAAPMRIQVSSLGENAGYKIIEKHRLYVHRSLTREIVVFQKI